MIRARQAWIFAIVLAAAALAASALTTDRQQYETGDLVTISSDSLPGNSLVITAQEMSFRFLAGAGTSTSFIPISSGEHTAILADSSGIELERASFSVAEKTQKSDLAVSLEKDLFEEGELVQVTLSGTILPQHELMISSGKDTFVFVGLRQQISFVPKEKGAHSVILLLDGNEVYRKEFFVAAAEKAQPYRPEASPAAPPATPAGQVHGEVSSINPVLTSRKSSFKTGDAPEFSLEFQSKRGMLSALSAFSRPSALSRLETPGEAVVATVMDSEGKPGSIPARITKDGEGKFAITLERQREFRPGKYKLNVRLLKDGQAYVQEQDFTWGVLSMNTNKSVFTEGESAMVAIGVLDDAGRVVCDADVRLSIKSPGGAETILSTSDGSIKISDECSLLGVTNLPDYYATYQTGPAGTYMVNLTANIANGARSVDDSFIVAPSVGFSVARAGPTRIYPPVPYRMSIIVTASRDYNGRLTEYVPKSFSIRQESGLSIAPGSSYTALSWNVNLKKGDTAALSYEFDAPDVSPEFYLLGPLEIGSWRELRQWQIASDALIRSAGEKEQGILRAQGCRIEYDTVTPQTFSTACSGTYPSQACGVNSDRLSCDDGIEEAAKPANNNYGGVNITAYNTTITTCDSIDSVSVCFDWREAADFANANCRIGTHNGDLAWTTNAVTCPTSTASGLACIDVIGNEAWQCNDFFGTVSTPAGAMIEAQRQQGGQPLNLLVDVLYFNVTYFRDDVPPNISVLLPLQRKNISQLFLVNASVNDTSTVVRANLTFYNSTGNATGLIMMTRGAGTATAGYWNATFNSATLPDGFYNISVNATDAASVPNAGKSSNVSITIDNTPPDAAIAAPVNISNFSVSVLINASVSDSPSGTFNATFMLFNSTHNVTNWIYAERSSGTIYSGYWNATHSMSGMPDGFYNITINATDFAGNQRLANISQFVFDTAKPNASVILPLNSTNATADFLINASVNDSLSRVFNVSFRLYNHTSNATGWLSATMSSGSISAGYWNATASTAGILDGNYNVTINATDFAGNQLVQNLSSVTVDRSAPDAGIVAPLNGSNFSQYILINASVNDSASGVFNATFRMRGDSSESSWLFAALNSGSIKSGYWNSTVSLASIPDGAYNITMNATDFAGNQKLINISHVVVDKTQPNASAIAPLNGTNISGTFTINASVNDSLTRVFNATFRLINPALESGWLFAEMSSGSTASGYWNASIDASAFSDGFYNITINATDFAGNQKLINISEITIDNLLPNATIVVPVNDTNATADLLMNASVNDSLSSVFSAAFRLISPIATTGWLSATLNSGSASAGFWNATAVAASLEDGRYNITIDAADYAGNRIIANISRISVDRAGPNISSRFPVNVSNFSESFLINASVNDSVSEVFNATFRLINAITNTPWLYAELNSGTAEAGYWNATFDVSGISDGFYNITVNATDFANNQRLINISEVLVDRVLPNISIERPLNWTVVEGIITINSSVNDSSSQVWKVSYMLINESASSSWESAAMNSGTSQAGYWHVDFNTVTLPNGIYNMTINATDFAGNQQVSNISTVEINNIIDLIAPNISIVRPLHHSNLSGSFLVNASINDTLGAVAAANLTVYNSTGNATGFIMMTLGAGTTTAGYWNATVDSAILADGQYNLTVNTTDSSGNVNNSQNVSVTIDNTAANATIVLPLNSTIFTSQAILVNASANDTLSKVFSSSFRLINAYTATGWLYAGRNSGTMAEGYWNSTVESVSLPSGFYNITVNATDFAGNQLIANISEVKIDRESPNASVMAPLNNTNISMDFLINASVNDSVSEVFNATFRLTSAYGSVTEWLYSDMASGTTFAGFWNATFTIAAVPDGFYNITLNATDFAGNQNVINMSQVAIDREIANASIAQPLNNTNLTEDFLVNASLNDSTSGVFNASFRLISQSSETAWRSATMGSGSIFAGFWNATFAILSIPDGRYNLTINATDFARNYALTNITEVTIDNLAPNVSAISPVNSTNSSSSFLINASVNDSVSRVFNATFRLINHLASTEWLYAELNSGTAEAGYWSSTFDVSGISDGFYNITVNATDFAGNQNIVNISEVSIDKSFPNATSVAPLNGSNHSEDFLVNASVNDTVTGIFNTTFRLISGGAESGWLSATMNSGSVTAGYWNATFRPDAVSDGFYNITVNATDFAGNQKLANISSVMIDNAMPNISIVSPLNSTNTSADFVVNTSVNDSTSSVLGVSFRLMGIAASTEWLTSNLSAGTAGAGYWNATFRISAVTDGLYNITANATDFAGNQHVANISEIAIDTESPNATRMVPGNSSEQAGQLLINASVNDSVSKVNTVRYRLITDDYLTVTGWIAATLSVGSAASGYWNATFDTASVGDDTYNITIEATDFAGNQRLSNITTISVVNNDIIAAGENEEALLMAKSCNREDSATTQAFSLACAGTYPAACPSNRLSCNDATSETSALSQDEFGGVNISAYNSTINNCLSIKSVRLCYEWSTSDSKTYSPCQIAVDNDGSLSWGIEGSNCPTTTTDILTCVDVTGLEESWSCSDFFSISGPSTWAYIEGRRIQSGGAHNLNVDALYFNVTYLRDSQAPSVGFVAPPLYANISGSFLVNAQINDTGAVSKANLTIYNNTGNATGLIMMSLASGTLTSGYWNADVDSATLRDGRYNLSINATDAVGNINITSNHSITIDNTLPNISVVAPLNNTAFSALSIPVNASANDSLTGVFNVSFRLGNSSSTTSWSYATINSGSISAGYWNATITATSLASGQYNITANVTDFALNQRIINISTINISRADLTINSTGIVFVNDSPVEEQNITINATIHNIGLTDAVGFLVEFFNESIADSNRISNSTVPSLAAGASVIVNTTYISRIGPNNIYVRVDGNSSISEDNETNNEANNTLHVSGYSFYYGNLSRVTVLSTSRNTTLMEWKATNDTGNIYAADADSLIDFTALQALGRTMTGTPSSGDYAEADRVLNMTNFTDSIAQLYTNDGGLTPHTLISIPVYGNLIENVPATNSTNSTGFLTGILWDTGDDIADGEFDDTDREDMVFVTASGIAKNGKYGFYSSEMRVPTSLKRYTQPNVQDIIVFYAELT